MINYRLSLLNLKKELLYRRFEVTDWISYLFRKSYYRIFTKNVVIYELLRSSIRIVLSWNVVVNSLLLLLLLLLLLNVSEYVDQPEFGITNWSVSFCVSITLFCMLLSSKQCVSELFFTTVCMELGFALTRGILRYTLYYHETFLEDRIFMKVIATK